MTVASEVKQCLASLRQIEAGLSSAALLAQDDEAKQVLHDAMEVARAAAGDVKNRVFVLEREEAQYRADG